MERVEECKKRRKKEKVKLWQRRKRGEPPMKDFRKRQTPWHCKVCACSINKMIDVHHKTCMLFN